MKSLRRFEEDCIQACCECPQYRTNYGYHYDAGRALKLIDEVAFNEGFNNWSSEEFEEIWGKDMTQEEKEEYYADDTTVMYIRVEE